MDAGRTLVFRREVESRRWWYQPMKRGLDVILASGLLLCLSPIFAVFALAIVLDSPGPVIFRQPRVGKGGKEFTMLKFRTMFLNSDSTAHRAYATAFIHGKAERQTTEAGEVFKLVGDQRITRTGRWLRRTSLDELPQLWNVLRGEMSMVGPRPPIQYEVEQYQARHRLRLAAKPGITGLWQVSGRSSIGFEEMVKLDVAYIRRQSLMFDVLILLKTLPAIWSARGAY